MHSRHPGEGGELSQRGGAEAVQAKFGIALPDDADFETWVRAEPVPPGLHKLGLGVEVGDIGRHALQGGSEEPRQAQQGGVDIKLGHGVSMGQQPLDAGAAGQKADQGWLAHQDDTAATLVERRDVPDELQRIAQPLLGVDQDGPPVQGGAVPKGWLEGRQRTKFLALPPPFITCPSLLEATHLEPTQRPDSNEPRDSRA